MSSNARFFIPAALCLFLSGCVTYAEQAARKEADLWVAAGHKARAECGSLMGQAKTAVAADACVAAIVRSDVLPYVHYPDFALALIDEQATTSRDYQDGKLDDTQAAAKAKYLQQQYEERVRNRLQGG